MKPIISLRLRPLLALPEPVIVYDAGALCAVAAAIFWTVRGPMPVLRGSTPLPIPTPLGYQAPVFLPFGMLAGELAWAWLNRERAAYLASLPWQLAALCAVALIRLTLAIPVSGHAVLLAFFLLHELVAQHGRHLLRALIGLAVLTEVAYFKLMVWDDGRTLVAGLVLGAGVWAAGRLTQLRFGTGGDDRRA